MKLKRIVNFFGLFRLAHRFSRRGKRLRQRPSTALSSDRNSNSIALSSTSATQKRLFFTSYCGSTTKTTARPYPYQRAGTRLTTFSFPSPATAFSPTPRTPAASTSRPSWAHLSSEKQAAASAPPASLASRAAARPHPTTPSSPPSPVSTMAHTRASSTPLPA